MPEPQGPGGQLIPTFSSTRSTCGVCPPLFVSYSDFHPHFSLPFAASLSLPYSLPFWVIAELKGNEVGREVTGSLALAILNLAELNLHPRACPDIVYFYHERGR